jgi:hypothetical protein
MPQIIRMVSYSPIRGPDLPREVLAQFREDLIAAYLKAGLLGADEVDRAWLIVEPLDLRMLMEQPPGEDTAADEDERHCYLVTLPENAADFLDEGVIAFGPNGEYVDTRSRPTDRTGGIPLEEERPLERRGRDEPPTGRMLGTTVLQPFAVLYLKGAWTPEDLNDRVRLLVEFLARHGFLSYDDLTHFRAGMFLIGPRNTVLHFYLLEDSDSPFTSERQPPRGEGPKTDPPSRFDPDAVKDILKGE